jgi:hypothetical protein
LLLHMTPDNCVILLLHGDLNNPAEYIWRKQQSSSGVIQVKSWQPTNGRKPTP